MSLIDFVITYRPKLCVLPNERSISFKQQRIDEVLGMCNNLTEVNLQNVYVSIS